MDTEGEFCVIATWSPGDPERYCQCHIPSGSYSKTMALVGKIYSDGWEDMGRPDAIKIEKI